MNPTIVYVHGAGCSPISFNYICSMLPEHTQVLYSYNAEMPVDKILNHLYESLCSPTMGKNYFLVGHSLGGVIATALTYRNNSDGNKLKINGVVSMSAPFGGSKVANYLKLMYPKYGLFDNIATFSPVIKSIGTVGAIVPTMNIVTSSGGIPMIKGENDGVVSVRSQKELRNCQTIEIRLNHFEILISKQTVDLINKFVWDMSNINQTSKSVT
jgi:triacylglycerol esterase/lipase EstA (alpha/beta hydrolase family)